MFRFNRTTDFFNIAHPLHSGRCMGGGEFVEVSISLLGGFQDTVERRELLINRLIGMHLRHGTSSRNGTTLCICVQECPACPRRFVRMNVVPETNPDELETYGSYTCIDGSTRSLNGICWFIEEDEVEADDEVDVEDDRPSDVNGRWNVSTSHSHMCRHRTDYIPMLLTHVYSEYASEAEHISRLASKAIKELDGQGAGVMILVQDCPQCPYFFETVVSADTCSYTLRSFGAYTRPDGSSGDLDGYQWYLSEEVGYERLFSF